MRSLKSTFYFASLGLCAVFVSVAAGGQTVSLTAACSVVQPTYSITYASPGTSVAVTLEGTYVSNLRGAANTEYEYGMYYTIGDNIGGTHAFRLCYITTDSDGNSGNVTTDLTVVEQVPAGTHDTITATINALYTDSNGNIAAAASNSATATLFVIPEG